MTIMTNTGADRCGDCAITPDAERVGTMRNRAAAFTILSRTKTGAILSIHVCAQCARARGAL